VSAQPIRAHSCFIGNINYDASEEQLLDIFREVGEVVSLRLVSDKETGKPKGYGFVEYKDAETALSAIRNLSGREISGRALRLDVAEGHGNAPSGPSAAAAAAAASSAAAAGGPGSGLLGANSVARGMSGAAALGAGPIGGAARPPDYVPMGSAANAVGGAVGSEAQISAQLEGMSHEQLWSLIANMKEQIEQTPEQARQILEANPQLAYALLQAQVMLGMVKPEQLMGALAQAQQQQQQQAQPQPVLQQPPIAAQPIAMAPVVAPLLPDPIMQPAMYGGFGGMPTMAPPPTHFVPVPTIAPEQAELLRQVAALTAAQIAILPDDQRAKVLEIRRQLQL
jgi:cleavage stimulation factor subunit 2